MRTHQPQLWTLLLALVTRVALYAQAPQPTHTSAAAGPATTTSASSALPPGQYVFLVRGSAGGKAMAAVGSVALDGNGNLSGEEDLNSSAGVGTALPVQGIYSVDGSGVGLFSLTSTLGSQQFSVFLPSLIPPVGGTLIETDGGATGVGSLTAQQTGFVPFDAGGNFALDLRGETACTDCSALGHDSGPVLASGQLLFTPSQVTATVSQSIGATLTPPVTLLVPFASADVDNKGRFAFTAGGSGEFVDEPTHFAVYFIDSNRIVLLSTDPHANSILLSGTGRGIY